MNLQNNMTAQDKPFITGRNVLLTVWRQNHALINILFKVKSAYRWYALVPEQMWFLMTNFGNILIAIIILLEL